MIQTKRRGNQEWTGIFIFLYKSILLKKAFNLGLHLSSQAEKEPRYVQHGPLLLSQ
jgi:hypothetical protein